MPACSPCCIPCWRVYAFWPSNQKGHLAVANYSPNRACTDGVLTVLPSSLDLLNSVVWECRPDQPTGAPFRAAPSRSQDPDSKIQESANLETQESGNLGSPKTRKKRFSKSKSVSPKMSERSGSVRKQTKKASGPI